MYFSAVSLSRVALPRGETLRVTRGSGQVDGCPSAVDGRAGNLAGDAKGDRVKTVQRASALRFQLLGHLRASVNGEPFRLTTRRKMLPLLGYLLLHPGATVSRDFLAFLLWPDEEEDVARTRLRATLHDLVSFLPPAPPDRPWISTEGTGICWNADAGVAVDVNEFEVACRAQDLERAAELYGGDLLEGLYDEWLIAPRERLRGAYLAALTQLVSEARRGLDYASAIAYARQLQKADPLREDVARRLIALRYEAGDRAGALAEYELLAERLREELSIEPMPETAMLREAIVRNHSLPAGDRFHADHIAGRAPARSQLPFVGRSDEMNRLLDAWGRAVRGRGGLAFVEGTPGIGKSRLVAELSRAVEERGGRVLAGATGFPEATPYQAFLEALRGALPLLTSAQLDGVTQAELTGLLPELTHVFDNVPPLRSLEPESERTRTLTAMAHAFSAMAQPRPLLVVLEDLHWAQEATISALALLARRTSLSQLLVVATYREGDLARSHALRPVRAEALRSGWALGITVGPLSADNVAEIAKGVASPLADSPDALRTACAGNPLLLSQLLAGPAPDLSHGDTLRIDTLVGAQLERLSAPARAFAEIAALVGTRFSHEVVREAGGWDAPSAGSALDELLDRKLVAEAGGYGDFDYAFAHQLVRDVVAENAPPRRAADRHRRIARVLEELYPGRQVEFAAQLGLHYELGGDAERAGSRFALAGRRALQMSALDQARAYLRRGLELATDPKARADAFIDLIEVCRRTDDAAERSAALAGLDEAAKQLDDDEYRRTAALLRVKFYATENDAAASEQAREQLRTLVRDAGPRWQALLLIEEARSVLLTRGIAAAVEAADAALEAAKEAGDASVIARALIAVGGIRGDRGDVDGALQLLEAAKETAFHAGDGDVELEALLRAYHAAYKGERLESALAIAERWLERAQSLGDRYAEALARVRLAGMLVSLRRDLRRAIDELDKPMALHEDLRSRHGIARVQANRAIVYCDLGNLARAAECFEEALVHFTVLGDVVGRAMSLMNRGLVRAYAGDPEGGRRDAAAALDLVREDRFEFLKAGALENLAVTTAFCGDLDEAIRLGTQALARHKRTSTARSYPRMLGDLAIWSARRGDLNAARIYVDELLGVTLPRTTEFAQTCPWAAAQVLRACREPAAAAVQLEQAYRLVATLAEALGDEERARFEAIPWNREILAARDRDEWPDLGGLPGA